MTILLLAACSENNLVGKDDAAGPDGDAAAPDIVVEPASIDFGAVLPGATGVATVSITNVGDDVLNLANLSLRGDAADVTWTNLSSPLVRPGASVDTVVTWAPFGAGGLADALLVDSDDPDEARVAVPLAGAVPVGDIAVDPARWDFGSLEVGAEATTTVTVSNVGEGPLTISAWGWTATDLDMEAFEGAPMVLGAGESTDVPVRYAPSGAGVDEGTLTVSSDDPDTPSTGAQLFGAGTEPDPCDGFTQTVDLLITADDAWQAWIDGTEFTGPNSQSWSASDSFQWELPCGDHALAVYATDLAQAVSGLIAVVSVEGSVRFLSGPTNWTMLDSEPPAGWTDVSFDDAAWHIPEVCASRSIWGSSPQPFYDAGAQWIWWSSDCSSLGEAWFRLNFTVP